MNFLGYFGGTALGMQIPGGLILWTTLAIIWSVIWKGIALWKCGRNNQLAWFIVLLVVNTLGLLEITYLAFFQKSKRIAMPARSKARRR